jgi:hypothetical protein
MTTEKRPAAPMDAQKMRAMLRAARGSTPAAPTAPVPMGIRYRTPAVPARPAPAGPRPRWAVLAAAGLLEEIAEPAPRRAKAARPATSAPTRPASAPASAPVETSTARTAAAKPVAARKPAAKPRAAELRAAEPPRVAEPTRPRLLGSYDAYACEACGSRYSKPFTDHGCGPLIPVTVTIATRAAGGPA